MEPQKKRARTQTTTETLARQLYREGYAVVHNSGLVAAVKDNLHRRFQETLQALPEYRRDPKDPTKNASGKTLRYAMGGFGALGVPSSFHNPLVRDLRSRCMAAVQPVLAEYAGEYFLNSATAKIEQLVDRMLYRPAGDKPSAESWHRDQSPDRKDGDLILGGWINLDAKEPQHLCCVPGSHSGVQPSSGGFAPITDKKKRAEYKQKARDVCVQPGEILLFVQEMVHQVRAKVLKHDMQRLFLGWRITYSAQPLQIAAFNQLQGQSPVLLKSGQRPPMYARLHWANWADRLSDWATESLQDSLLCERTFLGGQRKGERCQIPLRFVHALRCLDLPGFDGYPAYRPEELQMHRPSYGPWTLHDPATGKPKRYARGTQDTAE